MTRTIPRTHKYVIAKNLREAQAKHGISNESLARKVEVTLRVVQKWRAGDAAPTYENLVRVATALEIPVGQLLNFQEGS